MSITKTYPNRPMYRVVFPVIGLIASITLAVSGDAQVKPGAPKHWDKLVKESESVDYLLDPRSVVEEAAEPSDINERTARANKNRRYNTGGKDLTLDDSENYIEHIWPRGLPLIPTDEGAVIVVGTVVHIQPYLSEDRSSIYTEFKIDVEDVLKNALSGQASSSKYILIDKLGGKLRLKSGRIVYDEINICYLGEPRLERRYVLFARSIHNGNDLEMIKGYELRDGKVFTISEGDNELGVLVTTLPDVPKEYAKEETLLELIKLKR